MAERYYVVVVQSDKLSHLSGYSVVVVVPMTSKQKSAPTRVQLLPESDFEFLDVGHPHSLKQPSQVKCEQVLSLDLSCFSSPVGKVNKAKIYEIATKCAEYALGLQV